MLTPPLNGVINVRSFGERWRKFVAELGTCNKWSAMQGQGMMATLKASTPWTTVITSV